MAFEVIPGAAISTSGLDAERARMEVIANNLSNINSTSKDGNVYRRRIPVFEAVYKDVLGGDGGNPTADLGGVKLTGIEKDDAPPLKIYAPYHPHADKDGMLAVPSMSPMEEMVDMISASRAYEANLSALRQARDMADKTITLGKQ